MDLVAQEVKIKEFLHKYSIKAMKYNESPWGSYSLALSFGNDVWFIGRRYGWGFSLKIATIEEILFKLNEKQIDNNFMTWLGKDKYEELVNSLKDEWKPPIALLPPTV